MNELPGVTPRLVAYELMYRENFLWEQAAHPSCVLFIIKSGTFVLTMHGKKVTVSDNDVVLFPAGLSFYRKIISPITFHYLQLLPSNMEGALPLPEGKIHLTDQKRLLSTIEAFDRIAGSTEKNKARWCQHLVDDIFYQCYFETHYMTGKHNARPSDASLQAVIEYFQSNLQQKIHIGEVARRNGITHAGLIGKFKGELGVSPVEYLILLRINKAKHLLLSTDLPISHIAETCGFSNCYYFSNAFKKHTAYSPTQYRLSFHA